MTTRTRPIAALFIGLPGDARDVECCDIFERHGGEFVNSGSFVETRERDVEYDVPRQSVRRCVDALRAAGFDVAVGAAAIREYWEEQLGRAGAPR